MRYVGDICDKCNLGFVEQDEVVVCPQCGTPHHKHCWQETNSCVNEGRHSDGFIWQPRYNKPDIEAKQCANKVQICPSCGAENENCEPNCINCGERIYLNHSGSRENAETQALPFGHGQSSYGDNARQNIDIDGIPANEVAAYIQGNADIYITKFLRMDQSGTQKSFNWVAAFFPYVWLFYRKMYKAAFLCLALFLAFSILPITRTQIENNKAAFEIIQSVANNEISLEQAQNALSGLPQEEGGIRDYISLGLKLSLSLFIALKADAYYRKKVVEDILKSREEANDTTSYFSLLFKKGGGSVLAMIGGFALYHSLALFLELYVFNLFF